jgi:hypothetical protein
MQHLFDPLPDGSGEFAGNVFIRREVTEEHRMEFEKDYMKEVLFRRRFKRFWLISEIVTFIIWLGSDFLNLHDDITFISGEISRTAVRDQRTLSSGLLRAF